MFLDRFVFTCDQGDHVSLVDNRRVIRRTSRREYPAGTLSAWCLVCQRVVQSESVHSRDFYRSYREMMLEIADDDDDPIEDVPSADELDALIAWRAERESYPRCLSCFSEALIQQVPSPCGGGSFLLLHPACGGRFSMGIRYDEVDERPAPLVIDGEGRPIQDDAQS